MEDKDGCGCLGQVLRTDDSQGAFSPRGRHYGLERLLRFALHCLLEDVGLATVLGSRESACARTSQLRVELFAAVGRLLERVHNAGAIRPDIGADDIRRLMCGIEYVVRSGANDHAETDRYLGVLLDGLSPHN